MRGVRGDVGGVARGGGGRGTERVQRDRRQDERAWWRDKGDFARREGHGEGGAGSGGNIEGVGNRA